jgi:hypothetical protein
MKMLIVQKMLTSFFIAMVGLKLGNSLKNCKTLFQVKYLDFTKVHPDIWLASVAYLFELIFQDVDDGKVP